MSQSDHSASWTAACADPGGGGAGVDAGQLEHAQPHSRALSRADLGPVELLADRHGIEGFDCGVTALDRWLRNSARTAAAAGTAATYVLCRGHRVVGYYALAMGSVGAEFGARAVIVDAIDDDAAAFYRHFGFRELAPHRMWRRVADIAAALEP